MAILHKNITAAADIHNPKWFSGANNGDYAFKNEKGELESLDELLLPAALNFVDGSVAPPTTNSGDIYILSSGGSVNAGWGGVSLQDWVRYDGTAWNSITPQKSSLCYDKTADSLMVYDGSAWAAIGGGGGGGGNTIYTANDTIGSGRELTLTNTVRFKNGTFEVQGAGTGTASTFVLYDNDTIPNKTWEFLDNGSVNLNQNTDCEIGTNFFNFTNGNKKIGIPSWNTHVRWSIDNGNGARWDLISANSSSSFNADEFGIAKGSLIPLRVFDGTRVAVGNIAKASLDTNYTFQAGDTLVGGNLHSKNGTDFAQFDFTNYSKIKIGTSTSQWWLVNSNAGRSGSFDDNDLFIWDSTNSRKVMQFKANGTINMPTLPTSASGLSTGDLYNDSGTIKIV